MTKKTHDLAVKIREYADRNGNTKVAWQNIGALMESDDGKPFLMLEAWVNLAAFPRREGSSAVLVSCFEPREQDGAQGRGNGTRSDDRRPSPPSTNGSGRDVARNGGYAGKGRQSTEDELDDSIPF